MHDTMMEKKKERRSDAMKKNSKNECLPFCTIAADMFVNAMEKVFLRLLWPMPSISIAGVCAATVRPPPQPMEGRRRAVKKF
jgi:hypothetical protein